MNTVLKSVVRMSLVTASSTYVLCSCGHYPAPIRSGSDVDQAPSSEIMIVLGGLPLNDWGKLQKFAALEHLSILEQAAPQITDEHLMILAGLRMRRLRDVSVAYCCQVTDAGICSLTNIPSITSLQLIGTRITDEGLRSLATGLPNLTGLNVSQCALLTFPGLLSLTNSMSVRDVSFSLENMSQGQVERLIAEVRKVTWWTIQDPQRTLALEPLRTLEKQSGVRIQIEDGTKCNALR
jgi:hypothetical protein